MERPNLTDSGGFQVFLAKLRDIREEGVTFASHFAGAGFSWGRRKVCIQSNLGSTIAMAFDECVENLAEYDYAKHSCARTVRWLYRCREEMERLKRQPDTLNPHQMLWGINQGCTYTDIRIQNMREIRQMDLDGYAIGGLAVGESRGRDVSGH